MRRRFRGAHEKRPGLPPEQLRRVEELAAAAGQSVEQYLADAVASHAQRNLARPWHNRPTLYGRVEYAGGLKRLVGLLYPKVLADPILMHYFKHVDMTWLRWHVLTFLSVVTGGPSRYAGRDITEAHAPHFITGEAFDRLLVHLESSMDELEMALEDQKTIIRAVLDLRSQVVTFE